MNIHISRNGEQFGPYSPEQVREYLAAGTLLPSDMGWHEGAADWQPITQLVGGAASSAASVPCPKCGAALDPTDVICLACGHNLDEPELTEEQKAAIAKAEVERNRVPVPLPLTYEDETAVRAGAVSSVGYGLLVAFILPVFGTAGKFNFPFYDMWASAKDAYTWQMMFDVIAPAVAGVVCFLLASMMHGRARGGILLGLGLAILLTGLVDGEAGKYAVQYQDDNSTAVPAEPPPTANAGNVDMPEVSVQKKIGNQFYERVIDPADYAALVAVFFVGWVGLVAGTKVRFYRPESLLAYILSMVGAVAICLMWVLPVVDGTLPVAKVFSGISNDPMIGAGLALMVLLQIGAAVLCFMNRRGIRPSLIKKYSNLAGTLMIASVMVPVVPIWGKVIYDESNTFTETAEKRYKYVEGQFGEMYTSFDTSNRDKFLDKLEKPLNARIGSIFGWFACGAKYVAWLGGLFLLIPMAIVELICGAREPDGQQF